MFLKTYIQQIILFAYVLLLFEGFLIVSIVYRRRVVLLATIPTILAFWDIGTCTGHRVDNGKLYLADAPKLQAALLNIVCIGVFLGVLSCLIVKENKKQREDLKRRVEVRRQKKDARNKALVECLEFDEFKAVWDFNIPPLKLSYNCGSNQRFGISTDNLQKTLQDDINHLLVVRTYSYSMLSDACNFCMTAVLPNITDAGLRQEIQRKLQGILDYFSATSVSCHVYYKTPVRGEIRERNVQLRLVKSEPVTKSKTFAQEQRALVTPKIRFEVLKRDNFTCQYCGAHGDGVVLEVDHIVPVSKGGTSDMDNLITACFNCNRGKGDSSL